MAHAPFSRRALLAGLAGTGLMAAAPSLAQTEPKKPARVEMVNGQLLFEGRPLIAGDDLSPNGVLATEPGSEAIAVIGADAFLLRGDTVVEFAGEESDDGAFVTAMRLVSGGVLSVFGPKPLVIDTPVASIGIRGTGIYVEAALDGTGYACLCYGTADIQVTGRPDGREALRSEYHDVPRWIRPQEDSALTRAPVRNHTDAELILLESLVGRVPPFGGKPVRY